MLLEIGVADAYCCAFEYARPNGHRQNDLRCFYSHPKWKQIPGKYTDDTEMSIAIAELLLERFEWTSLSKYKFPEWTPLNIATKFVEVFHRNHCRTGYSANFYHFLCSVKTGAEFLAKIKPDSSKSGAAMRACPLGIISDIDTMLEWCEIQARVTHNTDAGVAAAQAASLMTHYLLYGLGPKAKVAEFVEAHIGGAKFNHDFREPWDSKVGEQGLESVHAAIQTVQTSNSITEIMKKCVDYGGDTDTVAAIACGAASVCEEIKPDTPEHLILTLENGPYGKDYLVGLDDRLKTIILHNTVDKKRGGRW